MHPRTTLIAMTIAAGATCSLAADAAPPLTFDETIPEALVSPEALTHHALGRMVYNALPAEHQHAIAAAGGIGPDATVPVGVGVINLDAPVGERVFDQIVSPELAARLSPIHRSLIETMIDRTNKGLPVAATCFAPGTDPELMAAIDAILYTGHNNKFQQTTRWTRTATDGSGLLQGRPTTITYSFPADGTWVPNIIGVSGSNNFNNWMNGIYGSQAVWQPLYAQMFNRWSDLIGTTYVYEPADDGANFNQNRGEIGVRGDVRIGGITIDGGFGILAYNNFPNDGDMIFDSADSFFNNTSNSSRRLRNVAAHEHGHGLGMLHVCPVNSTKLMEPFASTAFDGPQLDDILNGQRHYGDHLENDDTRATANDLGNFVVGSQQVRTNVSLDDDHDEDFFEINALVPITLQVSLLPDAGTWLQGPETGSCNTGTSTNYNMKLDLEIEVQNGSGTVLGAFNIAGLGGIEAGSVGLDTPGTYYIKVLTNTTLSGNQAIQRYRLTALASNPPFLPLTIDIPAGAPTTVDEDVAHPFAVTINANDESLVGTPLLFTSIDGAGFVSSNLTGSEPNFIATLPATACGSTIGYYISADGDSSGTILLPSAGAAAPFTAVSGPMISIFGDDFETDTGWAVSGIVPTPFLGQWQRGIPVDIGAGAPTADSDGSGSCYTTGNLAGSAFDVDFGDTVLTSPVLDASGHDNATVSYARWFSNDAGANPAEDVMLVEISDDAGGSWTELETVGPLGASGGWVSANFLISDFVTPSSQVQLRFTVADTGNDSDVEGAIDAVAISSVDCDDCPADLTGDGIVDSGDLSVFITAFLAGDLLVDYTGDGIIDSGDLSAFIGFFLAGC